MTDQALKSKATKGMVWNAFNTLVVQGVNILIGIFLARILMPSDYGLIGMLAIFIAISQLFIESGFSTALIQKNDCSDIDYSTVLYFNFAVAVTFYIVLFFATPLVAQFYHAPVLINLTRVLSLSLIINSLSIAQQARLYIKLDFRACAVISLLSVIISGSIAIFMAYKGFGVWVLVIQTLSYSLVKTFFLLYFGRWVPQLVFSVTSFKQLFGFSFKLLGGGLVSTIMTNIYSILIGRNYTARDLGFYTTAQKYSELLACTIVSILHGGTFPILASVQSEKERMIVIYERLMSMTVFFIMPIMALLALLAKPFIHVFLTDKWIPCVPLLQWLCLCRIITTVSFLNMNVVNVVGRSDLYLKVEVLKSPIIFLGLVLTIPLGLKAVVIGYFVVALICFFVNAYYPGKLFGYGAIKQIKEMRRVICAVLIMSLSIFGMLTILSTDFIKLAICIPIGIAIYLVSSYLFKIKETNEVFNMIRLIILKIKEIRYQE